MFGKAWRVGQIRGIDIRIDSSWLFIAFLIGYSFFLRYSALYRQLSSSAALALGAGATVLFFSSVLMHELAHSLAAKRRGIPVRGITLFLFGGATEAPIETRRPRDEFIITAVGPLTSLVLAALFWVLGTATRGNASEAVSGGLFGYLAWINLALALFNLLPGFPLDGGRLLRSAVWKATGDLRRATRIAATGGVVVGYLMVGYGLFLVFGGALVGGLWFAAIGWFLSRAARAAYAQLQVSELLEGVTAGEVMASELVSIPADVSIQTAVDDYFMRLDHGAFPVVEGDRTIGVLSLRRIRRLPREEWDSRTARDAMVPVSAATTVSADTPVTDVVEKLQEDDTQRVLVARDGDVAGMITANDLARWFRRRQLLEQG